MASVLSQPFIFLHKILGNLCASILERRCIFFYSNIDNLFVIPHVLTSIFKKRWIFLYKHFDNLCVSEPPHGLANLLKPLVIFPCVLKDSRYKRADTVYVSEIHSRYILICSSTDNLLITLPICTNMLKKQSIFLDQHSDDICASMLKAGYIFLDKRSDNVYVSTPKTRYVFLNKRSNNVYASVLKKRWLCLYKKFDNL